MGSFAVENVRIVTPGEVFAGCALIVDNGRIFGITPMGDPILDRIRRHDGRGNWLLPGLVDLHNDGLEKEIEPRPRAFFPLDVAIGSFENRLVSHGITTIFNSISFMEGRTGTARGEQLEKWIDHLAAMESRGVIRSFLHARYEISEPRYHGLLVDIINRGMAHLVSFMDHTPGQGQFRNAEKYMTYMRGDCGLTEELAQEIKAQRLARRGDPEIMEALVMVADAALRAGVTMASHDDDCAEKVAMMREIGVAISEFPVELEAARAASGHGMHVVVGAPNVLLGGSNSGNMSAVDAIREKMAAVLCSDYYAPALLPAVFHLHRAEGIPMAEAVRMASENPARAVGMEDRIGSLRPGLAADFILVEENGRNPVVREAWVAGKRVFTKAAGSPFTDEVYDVAAGETIHAS